MRRIVVYLSLIAVLLAIVASPTTAGNPTAPLSTPELRQVIGSGKQTVVFFLNPNGGPCRVQNDILQKLLQDRKNNFTIAYVSAMEPANRQAFYDYGVRNLPSLVLVDKAGKISRVFPPGIQTYEDLASALDGMK